MPSLDLSILLPVAVKVDSEAHPGRKESPPKPEEDLLLTSVQNRDPSPEIQRVPCSIICYQESFTSWPYLTVGRWHFLIIGEVEM